MNTYRVPADIVLRHLRWQTHPHALGGASAVDIDELHALQERSGGLIKVAVPALLRHVAGPTRPLMKAC